ncbi:MAG: OmpH family outer membrane protein [Bacteroidales bacterium]|nr:OmpH family outer membrane protein [Bacteroidales bacterium]
MKRIFVLAACAMMAVSAFAQKFGNVDSGAIMQAMPERTQVEKDLEAIQAKYETELTKMGDEYQKKVADFIAERENLEAGIQEARAQEIQQLEQRIQNFREMAGKDIQTQYQNKMTPLIEKINKAIQAVGEKEGFTYIFDTTQGNILYFSPSQCIDVLPLVKKELGIQ